MPDVQLCDVRLTGVQVREAPTMAVDGTIGTGILGRFRYVLKISAGSLWLGSLPPQAGAAP